jgi:toluene monooxygenase system protein E
MQLAELARAHGDALLALILDDFELDSERSRDWSTALVQYAVAQRPVNAELLKQWGTHWKRLSCLSMEALAEFFGQAPRPLQPEVVATDRAPRCGLNMVEI